jgi:hypothetical protein
MLDEEYEADHMIQEESNIVFEKAAPASDGCNILTMIFFFVSALAAVYIIFVSALFCDVQVCTRKVCREIGVQDMQGTSISKASESKPLDFQCWCI